MRRGNDASPALPHRPWRTLVSGRVRLLAPVSTRAHSPRNDDEAIIQPEGEPLESQGTLIVASALPWIVISLADNGLQLSDRRC